MSALCAQRREESAEARRCADAVLDVLRRRPTFTYGQMIALGVATEAYVALWQKSRDEEDKIALHERIRQSLPVFRRLAALIPVARPHAYLWHGQYAALRGHTRLAEWLLRTSLRAAEHYHMPFEEALAHQALAEVAQARGDRAAAKKKRSESRVLFERLGVHWHVAGLSRLDTKHAS